MPLSYFPILMNVIMPLSLIYFFSFASNSDAVNLLIFGKNIGVWLNYTLIFFAFTSIAFAWVWLSGLQDTSTEIVNSREE